jgi:hypothetical protein
MTEEKIEKAAANLELAIRKIELYQKRNTCPDGKEYLDDSLFLIKESLEVLRGFEIASEIESYSGDE